MPKKRTTKHTTKRKPYQHKRPQPRKPSERGPALAARPPAISPRPVRPVAVSPPRSRPAVTVVTAPVVVPVPEPVRAKPMRPGAGEWHAATVGAAAVGLVAVACLTGAFALVVAAVWAAVAFCRRHRRPDGESFGEHLAEFGVLYLVPVGIAATAYYLLSLYLQFFDPAPSIGWLISTQQFFEAVSSFFSTYLKLSELALLGVLVAVYLLTCWVLSRRTAVRAHRVVELYSRYSGPVAAGLATLAAVSLFGMQLGVPATDEQVKIKIAQRGYAEVTRKIEADLTKRVTGQVWRTVLAGLPKDYRAALTTLRGEVPGLLDVAHVTADDARISLPPLDKAVAAMDVSAAKTDAVPAELRVPATGEPAVPDEIDQDDIDRARAAIDAQTAEPGIDVFDDGRKKITLQVEKVVTEQIVSLTKPLTDAIPLLGPLIQGFAEAADKGLQARLAAAYDRLVHIAVTAPADLGTELDEETSAIVAQTDVGQAVTAVTPSATKATRTFDATVSTLRDGPAKVMELEAKAEKPPATDTKAGKGHALDPLPPLLPEIPLYYPTYPTYPTYPDYSGTYGGEPGGHSYGVPPEVYEPHLEVHPPVDVVPEFEIPFF